MKQLLAELNRRNVIRMAIAYGVTCWLMLQVADIGLQAIAAPDWVMRAFVLAFVVGLPFVLIFSWVYELTPDGLKREADVEPDASVTDVTARKLDYVVIGLLVFVLGIVVMRMVSQPTSAPAQTTADTRPAVNAEETSVAVLAFENMSADAEQGYFADGLSEELLNKLAQNPEIKVAGRTSSFAFKGQNRDLREIGEILNVAYILEGSVRKAGNQIRVTAQLVDAAEGFQLFSETYDGNLTDVFRVQDTIARQISQTLISQLTGTIDESDVTDPAAYELFLRARQDIVSRDTPRLQSASVMLDRVLDIDPEYAPALAQKALVVYLLSDASGAYGQVPVDVAVPEAQRFATQVLELAPNLADAHAVNGLLLANTDRIPEAIIEFERALQINPASTNAALWLSTAYAETGRALEANALLESMVERDPLFGPAFANTVTDVYLRGGEVDKALSLVNRVERIAGPTPQVQSARSAIAIMQGDAGEALRFLRDYTSGENLNQIDRLWRGFALGMLGEYEALAAEGRIEQQILAHAVLGDEQAALSMMRPLRDLPPRQRSNYLRDVCYGLIHLGKAPSCIELVTDDYADVDQLMSAIPVSSFWGIDYAASVAYAYLQIGDIDSHDTLVEAMQVALPLLEPQGSRTWVVDTNRLQLAALIGDREAMLQHLERAVAKGGMMYPDEWTSWYVAAIREEPRFIELRDQVDQKRDEQRAIVGLSPYSAPFI